MPKIEIYVSGLCPYCYRAKALLNMKGVDYTEHDVTMDPKGRAEMTQRADGRVTVPQIFIDGRGIGGCDDMHALDAAGQLDRMLGIAK